MHSTKIKFAKEEVYFIFTEWWWTVAGVNRNFVRRYHYLYDRWSKLPIIWLTECSLLGRGISTAAPTTQCMCDCLVWTGEFRSHRPSFLWRWRWACKSRLLVVLKCSGTFSHRNWDRNSEANLNDTRKHGEASARKPAAKVGKVCTQRWAVS
jgi:hypothetical protein